LFRDPVVRDPALASALAHFHCRLSTSYDLLEVQSTWINLVETCVRRHARAGDRPQTAGFEPKRIKRVRDLVESCCHQPLTLGALAREAGLSPPHFMRVFKAATGMSPHAYTIQSRVRRARSLLRQGESVASAAVAAGFTDQSHLTRHFKATFGFTPGRYAAEILKA
jgi:transcriptional regulator GlxA family with amidase domain